MGERTKNERPNESNAYIQLVAPRAAGIERARPTQTPNSDAGITRELRVRRDRENLRDEQSRDALANDFFRRACDITRDWPASRVHLQADVERLRHEPLLQTSRQLDRYLSHENELREEQPIGELRNRYNARCCAVAVVRAEVREREMQHVRGFARDNVEHVRALALNARADIAGTVIARCMDDTSYLHRGTRRREFEEHLETRGDTAFAPDRELCLASVAYVMKSPAHHLFDLEVLRMQEPHAYCALEAAARARDSQQRRCIQMTPAPSTSRAQ